MDREIERVRAWVAEVFPARKEGFFIGALVSHYIDDLMRDMGLKTTRLRNPFKEYLDPFWPSRYKGLSQERRQART
jgi:hypothetical protein